MSAVSTGLRVGLAVLASLAVYLAAGIFGFAFPVMGGMNLGRALNLADALFFLVPLLAVASVALVAFGGWRYWRTGRRPDVLTTRLTIALGVALIVGTGALHGLLLSFSGV